MERKFQWSYLMPVVAAPVAHIFVSLSRRSGLPARWRNAMLGATAGATFLAVAQRLYFVKHASYAGGDNDIPEDRWTQHERQAGKAPGMEEGAKGAWCGGRRQLASMPVPPACGTKFPAHVPRPLRSKATASLAQRSEHLSSPSAQPKDLGAVDCCDNACGCLNECVALNSLSASGRVLQRGRRP